MDQGQGSEAVLVQGHIVLDWFNVPQHCRFCVLFRFCCRERSQNYWRLSTNDVEHCYNTKIAVTFNRPWRPECVLNFGILSDSRVSCY